MIIKIIQKVIYLLENGKLQYIILMKIEQDTMKNLQNLLFIIMAPWDQNQLRIMRLYGPPIP